MRANEDIRGLIKSAGFCSWEVADKLGVHENTLCRKLRKPLELAEKQHLVSIIKQMKIERQQEVKVI